MRKPKPLTIVQPTTDKGWPKARELIEFVGHHVLEATDRVVMNRLYQMAHDSGRMGSRDAEWTMPMVELRGSHGSNDRLRASLIRLMQVTVTVPYLHPDTGEPREIITHLFDFFDISKDNINTATVRFGLPKMLQPILAQSGKWGRIKAAVIMAMTSKYAIAVYELVQARAGLNQCSETIPIDKFRQLVGVPPGKLVRGLDFQRRVIEPAQLEVNALSDVGVNLEIVRKTTSPLSPITAIKMTWWNKSDSDLAAVIKERQQPKFGRMARLKGDVETIGDFKK